MVVIGSGYDFLFHFLLRTMPERLFLRSYCSSLQDLHTMTLPTRKNYICTCVSFINILTELPKPSTTTLAYMEDYDEKTHIKGKMRSCKMITQAIFPMVCFKTFWKIETANAIFWMYLGGTAQKIFFLGIKLFCFSR